jgi:hypothetical protein
LADDADGDSFGTEAVRGEFGCDRPSHSLD